MKPQHPKDPRGIVEWVMDALATLFVAAVFTMFLAWLYHPALI